jgi:hypothetical protein
LAVAVEGAAPLVGIVFHDFLSASFASYRPRYLDHGDAAPVNNFVQGIHVVFFLVRQATHNFFSLFSGLGFAHLPNENKGFACDLDRHFDVPPKGLFDRYHAEVYPMLVGQVGWK